MIPINLYFAGAWSGLCSKKESDLGVKHKLVSFMYPDQLKSWWEVSKGVPGKIIVDSGAFSAWNKGKIVDLDAYIRYAKQAIEKGKEEQKKIHIVNLDVIPGKVGESGNLTKNRKQENRNIITNAAKQGYENLKKMMKQGITPIHVFHQGEDWIWLERMIQLTQYIGISPANDLSTSARRNWIDQVFEYLYSNNLQQVKTHGFAVWAPIVLREYPWTSCDAATWRLLAAYGGICYPQGGFSAPRYELPPVIYHPSSKKNSANLGTLTKNIIKMFETDGYTIEMLQSWETRAAVNIRYYLELERWLNEYKQTKEYAPRKGLCL